MKAKLNRAQQSLKELLTNVATLYDEWEKDHSKARGFLFGVVYDEQGKIISTSSLGDNDTALLMASHLKSMENCGSASALGQTLAIQHFLGTRDKKKMKVISLEVGADDSL